MSRFSCQSFFILIFLVGFYLYGEPVSAKNKDVIAEAQAVLAVGDFDKALELFKAAEKASRRRALEGQLAVHKLLGNNEELVTVVDELLRLGFSDARLKLEKALALRNLGRIAEAETILSRIQSAIGNDPWVLAEYGRYQLWKQDYDGARKSFERALKFEPDLADAQLGLAYVDVWKKNDAQAERRVDRILATHPKHVDALILKGWLAAWSGDFMGAEGRFDAAEELASNHPEALRGRAQVAAWKGDHAASAGFYRQLLAMQPNNVDLMLELGRELRNAGDYSDSVTVLSTAQKLDPQRVEIGEELEIAKKWLASIDSKLRELKKKISLNKGNVQDLITLGKVYDWLGQLSESRVAYEKALGQDPQNVQLLYSYARVLENQGEDGKAKIIYERMLALQPDFLEAQSGLKRIRAAYRPTLTFRYNYDLLTTYSYDTASESLRNRSHGVNVEYGQKLTATVTARAGYSFSLIKDELNDLNLDTYQLYRHQAYLQGEFALPGEVFAIFRYDAYAYDTFNSDVNLFSFTGTNLDHGGLVYLTKGFSNQTLGLQLSRTPIVTWADMSLDVDVVDAIALSDDIALAPNLTLLLVSQWSQFSLTDQWAYGVTVHPRYRLPFLQALTLEYEWNFLPDTSMHYHRGIGSLSFSLGRFDVQAQAGATYYRPTEDFSYEGNAIVFFPVYDGLNVSAQTNVVYYQQGWTLNAGGNVEIRF